ncbi:hypothetical protein BD626DRAFT_477239 [Schizophyllum amplum]|uniref:GDP/GTP exchange factor Sec2 N-terminal domain-containing protein n=1 Tax=Schizophyllum amplum TaxID=97359 RepID=A0A550D004_9AGAR|nr:hypothetical protein BD626DRAFT_477239 [Auriculariopsis ampla]
MLHFPSSLQSSAGANSSSKRDTLNATQQKQASHPVLLQIENELHDARRVHSHGQEDDLRYALDMVIKRLSEVSGLLAQAYKTQTDLEVQLNVTQSNLKLVSANNEMLEEALRNNASAGRDVGWRRAKPSESESRKPSMEQSQVPSRSASIDGEAPPPPQSQLPATPTPNSESSSAASSPSLSAKSPNPAQQESRFFKFRFGSSTGSLSRTTSRPDTPNPPVAVPVQHTTTSSLPVGEISAKEKELENMIAELERRRAELEKERQARQETLKQKEALEAELESLSQALFEEANKMVASERIKAAETMEELREALMEKEALRSALKLIERENKRLREPDGAASDSGDTAASRSSLDTDKSTPPTSENGGAHSPIQFHSRSSSQIGMKSVPTSPTLRENRASVISMLSARHIPTEGSRPPAQFAAAAPAEATRSPSIHELPTSGSSSSPTPMTPALAADTTIRPDDSAAVGTSAQTTPRYEAPADRNLPAEGSTAPAGDADDRDAPSPSSLPSVEVEASSEEKAARRSIEILQQMEPENSPWTAEASRWAAMATM